MYVCLFVCIYLSRRLKLFLPNRCIILLIFKKNISAASIHRLAELTRQELLRRHKGRVANAVIHVAPLGATGLGEKYPLWASKLFFF